MFREQHHTKKKAEQEDCTLQFQEARKKDTPKRRNHCFHTTASISIHPFYASALRFVHALDILGGYFACVLYFITFVPLSDFLGGLLLCRRALLGKSFVGFG